MKVLVGYDGSPFADAALEDLRLAGLPAAGEALVVTVGDLLLSPPLASHELIERAVPLGSVTTAIELAHEQEKESLGTAHRLVGTAVDRLQQLLPGWQVWPKALTGAPAEELLRESQFWHADLIIVGSRGLSALGRFFLGSVSKMVAQGARCSVRIARRAAAPSANGRGPRIIVGVDGSAGAARAVRAVGMRAWPAGTEVRLIAIDDGESALRSSEIPTRLEELVTNSHAGPPVDPRLMAEGAHVVLVAQGLDVTVKLLAGDPRRLLMLEAEQWQADCLFIGARGMESESAEQGLGSVSAKLVTSANCSVELVR